MSAWESWQLSERAGRAQAVLALIFLILGGAFFKAQVVDGAQFRLASEGSRLRPIPLPAPRGEIFDRNGLLIAENVPGYSIRLLATGEDSLRSVLTRLRAFVPADSVDVEKVVRLLTINEYKRRQSPVGVRITPRGFGKDWRYPITNRYREKF